jgi:competence protein ComEC
MDAGQRAPGPDLRLVALAFTAGVLLVHALPQLLPWPWLFACAAPLFWPWRGRTLLLAFALGLLLTNWHAQRQRDAQWPEAQYNDERWVQGVVASLPERTVEPAGDGNTAITWRFAFAPDDDALPSRLRVSWYRADQPLGGGECWRLKLRLRAPHGSLNPGGFDYEGWLFRQHIGATATVREATPCAATGGWPVLKLRQAWIDRVDAALGQRPGGALLKALTVGATSDLRGADWDVFRLTGTTHLVAISGFNLALVAGMAFFLLRWLWSCVPRLCLWMPAQRVALYGSALVASAYALLAGFEAPVARALFMLLVLLLAAALYRHAQPSRALALAWLLIVMADPCAVLTPGLWLSFGAVAAIFYLTAARWRAEPKWRAAIRVQIFLSIVLAPLTLYYFHGLAWVAPFVNLLAVPLFALLTPILLLAMLIAAAAGHAARRDTGGAAGHCRACAGGLGAAGAIDARAGAGTARQPAAVRAGRPAAAPAGPHLPVALAAAPGLAAAAAGARWP